MSDSALNKDYITLFKVDNMEAPDYSDHSEFYNTLNMSDLDFGQNNSYAGCAKPNYAFQEDKFLTELWQYIDSTYTAHYGDSKYQATDMIIDAGHGTGFNIGNIMKYAKRYGKKKGYNRADLLKIIHYAIMQLHVHEIENLEGTNEV